MELIVNILTNVIHTQVYRTRHHYIQVKEEQNPSIGWYLYLPFIVRSFATVTAMKLFVHLKIPTEAFEGLIKNIKYVYNIIYVCQSTLTDYRTLSA